MVTSPMPSKLTDSTCEIGEKSFSDRSASGCTKRCDANPDLPVLSLMMVLGRAATAVLVEVPMRRQDNVRVLSFALPSFVRSSGATITRLESATLHAGE